VQDHSCEGLRLPKHYASVQFVQVGGDEGAREFLDQLDNDYKGHKFDDFVDTTHWDAVIAGLGGVSREHLIAVMIVKCTLRTPLQAVHHMASRCGFWLTQCFVQPSAVEWIHSLMAWISVTCRLRLPPHPPHTE
jgi:hypothetical protein